MSHDGQIVRGLALIPDCSLGTVALRVAFDNPRIDELPGREGLTPSILMDREHVDAVINALVAMRQALWGGF